MSRKPRINLWTFIIDNSLLLVAGTVGALLWANLDHTSYERFVHVLHFPVNDIGMAFFFALAMKEIVEAMLPGGALASPREAAVPLLAAVGGMAGPAALYAVQVVIVGRPELMPGWAIPCATDIAFSYMAARLIFHKDHPAIPFLLLLAIADDALGLILIALFYPTGQLSIVSFAAFMLPAIGVAIFLKRRRIRNFWPYALVSGGLSWAALFLGGFHPALALVPIVPFMPHGKRDLGPFSPDEHGLPDTMNQFEHWWRVPVQVILLFFGLTNAGVVFSHTGEGTWIVMSSLIVGKPAWHCVDDNDCYSHWAPRTGRLKSLARAGYWSRSRDRIHGRPIFCDCSVSARRNSRRDEDGGVIELCRVAACRRSWSCGGTPP